MADLTGTLRGNLSGLIHPNTYADFGLQAIPAHFRYEPFHNEKGPR